MTVFAPASIGNVGPGFDVLGMAVTGRGDTVTARVTLTPGVRILAITGDSRNLPLDPGRKYGRNRRGGGPPAPGREAGRGAFHPQEHSRLGDGVVRRLGRGGRLRRERALWRESLEAGPPPSRRERGVARLRRLLSGQCRGVAVGGIIVTNPFSKHTVSLGTIPGLHIVIVTPAVEVLTKKARAILPKEISMDDFVTNMANACGMVRAVQIKDAVLFGTSIHDAVVEPHRAGLIPGFFDVKRSALSAGALGCSISGAGASVFAVADRKETAVEVGRAMQEAFLRHKVVSVVTLAKVDKEGARVIG